MCGLQVICEIFLFPNYAVTSMKGLAMILRILAILLFLSSSHSLCDAQVVVGNGKAVDGVERKRSEEFDEKSGTLKSAEHRALATERTGEGLADGVEREVIVRQDNGKRTEGPERTIASNNPREFAEPVAQDMESAANSDTLFRKTTESDAKYAMVLVRNRTQSVVVFDFKWGTGTWKTRSLDPGRRRWFSWRYDEGSTVSPSFYIRWNSSSGSEVTKILARYAATSQDPDQAATYAFNTSGSRVTLSAIDGTIYPATWTRVAYFSYHSWNNGVYLSGVHVHRRMGHTGYSWNYRVRCTDVSLTSGLPCFPGQHTEGYIRAKVSGPDGGYLDTGDMRIHSGSGNKEQVWTSANPGRITTCDLWRDSWCEW